MNLLINLFLVFFVLVALLMALVILMQRPKSEGLGAAFGGGVTENIFGAQTTTVLTKITGWLAGMFFVFTFLLSVLYAHASRVTTSTELQRELIKGQPATAASPTAASPARAVGDAAPVVPATGALTAPTKGADAPPAMNSRSAPSTPATRSNPGGVGTFRTTPSSPRGRY